MKGNYMSEILGIEEAERQNILIRRYCEEAEKIIEDAPDYTAAVRLKESLCRRFAEECDSELVVNATSQYLDRVLSKHWKV
jgi:AAA+ superfamily predicted ATPase